MARKRNFQKSKPGNKGYHKRSSSKARNNKYDDKPTNEASTTNDPSWYGTSPELVRDAASIPFSWPVGTDFHVSDKIYGDASPGIMSFRLMSGVGMSYDEQSPINVASSAIYSFVRHANSGHSNYDAPDLMIYLLAMSSIYSFVTWCQRLLGLVNMYDQRNRYIPKYLIRANYVNYENLRDNIANFRYWLNNYIVKVASLAVPNVMPVFQRLAFLYANVYIDGPTIKDQLYQYVPDGTRWLKFALDDNDRGSLVYDQIVDHWGEFATVAEIEAFGEKLFNAIWEQEDFGIMSGDILKAYQGNIIKLAPIPMELSIVPIYDAMVLHQMKNAKIFNLAQTSVTQNDSGLILADAEVSATSPLAAFLTRFCASHNQILTSDFDAPGPDVVIESTRLMPGYDDANSRWSTGLEICHSVAVTMYDNYDNAMREYEIFNDSISVTAASHPYTDFRSVVRLMGLIKAFKYAPELLAAFYTLTGEVVSVADYHITRMWDIDNYAVLSPYDLYKMNNAALMSLYAVPSIAKIS